MTVEHFESICDELEQTHLGLSKLCQNYGYKSRSSFYSLADNNPELMDKYTRARQKQLDYLEELLIDVSFNEGHDRDVVDKVNVGGNAVSRDRLKADTIKFVLGKLRRHVWGDKVDVTTNGKSIESVSVVIVRPDGD